MKYSEARRSAAIEEHRLRELLAAVAEGRTDIDAAVGKLRDFPYGDIGFAKVDHHRSLRDWMPEVILGEGKTPEQVVDELYVRCLSRPATAKEKEKLLPLLKGAEKDALRVELEDVFWALLNSNEFIFNH